LIQAALFSLSVGDSHIHPFRTLPRYLHVWLALQLAKYPLALSQLATRILPFPSIRIRDGFGFEFSSF